jgi:uncharacterized protein YciI
MKYLLRYTMAADVDWARVRELFPEHRQHWDAFRADGTLLAIGPMENPAEGALAILTSRAVAEQFAASDPFVTGGVVGAWDVTGWQEAILEPLSD